MTTPIHRQASRPSRLACALFGLATLLVLEASSQTMAQESAATWELRVCADPDNLPYSNREQEGFENAIVEILAEELGADVSYAWLPLPRREGQAELMVRMGACDLLASVPDDQEPYLTTLPYYRSIAVFVTRDGAPFEVDSLDDPLLHELKIGVLRGSPADYALVGRGMIDNVSHFFASDPDEEILKQVVDGSLDLGIVWGPVAGYNAERLDLPVTLKPVSPELDMPFLPMFQALSFGLRSDDAALGDLLNTALARRWDDIQRVLSSFGVPLLPLTAPGGATAPQVEDDLRIGIVLPTLTGVDPVFPMGAELIGEPALRGAVLAAERLDVDPQRPVELLVASAPSAAAAARAARRLATVQGADVLIGGLGDGQQKVIGAVAAEFEVPFLDIGGGPGGSGLEMGAEPDSRGESSGRVCRLTTFTVGANDNMYLEAMARAIEADGIDSWFVLHTDSAAGIERYEHLAAALERVAPSGEELGREAVIPGQPLYLPAFDAVAASGAEAVVLLLEADAQLVFLGQYETAEVGAVVYGFPAQIAQTRQFYAALAHDAHDTGAGPRIALWDASAPDGEELNQLFLARWGYPMDPTAWAAYAAVKVTVDAAAAAGSSDPEALIDHLTSEDAEFELHKGTPLSFRRDDRQLQQPLYILRLQPDAGSLMEIAEVVDEVVVGDDNRGCAPEPARP